MGNQPSSVAAENGPKEERRANIAKEILSTEQSYVSSLATVTELYLVPLMQSLQTPKPILTETEIKALFSDLNSILDFHFKVLKPEIHARVEKWSSTQCIGDVFVKHSEMMKIYTTYVNNNDGVHDKVAQFSKRKNFSAFLQEARSSPRHTQLDLMGYLIMPIQRIPRYVMLLSDLLKHTDPSHPDYKNLTEAKKRIEGVAKFINEQKREDEELKKVAAIQKTIEGNFEQPLDQAGRRLIKEGSLEIVKVLMKAPSTGTPILGEKPSTPTIKKFSLFWRAPKKVYKTGFLVKEGGFIKTLKKRWFILDGTKLSYYESEVTGKEVVAPIPKGVVDLTWAKLLSSEEKTTRGIPEERIALETKTGERVLIMLEENQKLKEEWASSIQEGIELSKKTMNEPESPSMTSKSQESLDELVDASKTLGFGPDKYYFFLFNDMVVQCSEKFGKTYKLRGSFEIKDSHEIVKTGEGSFVFQMDNLQLHFKGSAENVESWVKSMQKVISGMVEDKKNRLALEQKSGNLWQSVSNFFL